MITLFSDRYTTEHTELAAIIKMSYNTRDNRSFTMVVNGLPYQYSPELSTDLYAHYENETKIIVSVHGAKRVEEGIIAISEFLSTGIENQVVEAVCGKYSSLLFVNKTVLLLGHSLGCFAIVKCAMRFGKDFDSFFLAPYTPQPTGRYIERIRTTRRWKKMLYNTDWLSNNLIKENPQLSNVTIFKNTCLFCLNFVDSHRMHNFMKSPNEINQDLFRYFP